MVFVRINKIISICICFLNTLSHSAVPQVIQKLWGTTPPDYIQLGTFFYHVDHYNLPPFMTRPLVGLTYHSVTALFTKNCFQDNVFGLGVQRTLFSLQKETNLMLLGYRVGAVMVGVIKIKIFYVPLTVEILSQLFLQPS